MAETWELAAFLDSVIGAEATGAETVNGIATDRYRFDERAQGASGLATSDGDLWVATDGGYLVRYQLTTSGGADYFGTGIEGTWTWDYQLEDVGLPHVVEIPEACPPALIDFPMLPDAADVLEFPGTSSYTTTSDLEHMLAFYEEQVSAAGGEVNPPLILDNSAVLAFTVNDEPLLLTATDDGANTRVEITVVEDASQLVISAAVPDVRGTAMDEATPVPSTECSVGAESLPLLPDATSVQRFPGIISYMTGTSLADAATFYEEQLLGLGAQVSPALMPNNDFTASLTYTLNGQAISVMILAMGGSSANVSITYASTDPFEGGNTVACPPA
jgi:hypothetical protein